MLTLLYYQYLCNITLYLWPFNFATRTTNVLHMNRVATAYLSYFNLLVPNDLL